MPHELLDLPLDKFNFSLAVMLYAENEAAPEAATEDKDYQQMTPQEFMELFPGA